MLNTITILGVSLLFSMLINILLLMADVLTVNSSLYDVVLTEALILMLSIGITVKIMGQ
jgi:hypothetical protein